MKPTTPRLQLPEQVVAAWAAAAALRKRPDIALAMMLAMAAYLCPGELLSLTVESLHNPVRGGGGGALEAWSTPMFAFQHDEWVSHARAAARAAS